jgi:arsenite methyltransferase
MTSVSSYDSVQTHYSALAREDLAKNKLHIEKIATSFGYTDEDLAAIPKGANLGVSCGNPLALAGLKKVRLQLHPRIVTA